MEIAVFAKRCTGKDNKTFYRYLSSLTKKDGTAQTVAVSFRDEAGQPRPEKCPMNIIISKGDVNLASKTFVREDTGEVGTSYTLWVTKWKEGSPYVDHSLDEYEI